MTRGWTRGWLWVGLGVSLLVARGTGGGCSAAHPSPGEDRATATTPEDRRDKPGGSLPASQAATQPTADYDSARAFVTLSEITQRYAAAESKPAEPPASGSIPAPLSERGAGHVRRAEELLAEERYTEATQTLEKVLRTDPLAGEVHRALAWAAFGAGSTERARTHAAEAVRLSPGNPVAHYVLGRITFEQGSREEAIRHFLAGLRSAESDTVSAFSVLTAFHLAHSLEAEGYLSAAVEAYTLFERRAAGLTPATSAGGEPAVSDGTLPQELSALLRLNQGSAAEAISVIDERLGRFEEAADALGRFLALRKPDPAMRRRYVRLLTRAGRYEEALAQARLAANEASEPGEVIELLSDLRRYMGVPRWVLDDVAALVRVRAQDRHWLLAYVDLLRRFEQTEQAEQILADFVAAHPEASDVAWRLCDDYLRDERVVQAAELAARLVAANPREYGQALERLGALSAQPTAVPAVFAAVRPETPAARYVLGVLALRTGQTQQGVEWLRAALETAPDFTPARLALAEQWLSEYRWSEVADLLKGVEATDVNLEWALGEAYAGLDDDEQAAEHYSAAVRLNRVHTRARFALATLYERTDRALRAQRQYEALLEVDPLHQSAREGLAELLVGARLFEDAEAQVRELRKLAASPNVIARCSVRLQLGRGVADAESCRRMLRDGLAEGGPDADSLVMLASIDMAREEPAAAEETLTRALELAPDHLQARELRVWVYRGQLRFTEAAAELRTLLARHPNRKRWVKGLFDVLMIEQDYSGAADSAGAFLDRAKLEAAALRAFRLDYLRALRAAKRFSDEIAALQAWRNAEETEGEWRDRLADVYWAAGDKGSALSVVREAHMGNLTDAGAAAAYREVLIKVGRTTAAVQLVLSGLEQDPANETLQAALIDTLVQAGRTEEALELVENLLRTTQRPLSLLLRQRSLYQQMGRFVEAAALADRIRQDEELLRDLGPLDRVFIREQQTASLIGALLNAGRQEEARTRLSRWLEQATSDEEKFLYLNLLSNVYQQGGLLDKARESLELGYQLNPTDVGINNDLGYTLADLGQRLEQAEQMIRFAVAHDPMNGAYLDSLGWVLYRQGRFAEAQAWLRKAARTPETLEDPVIYDHLGDACWRVGAKAEAVEHWKRAGELAEERLREQQDATYRRVLDSAGEKRRAVEQGQAPAVAPVVGKRGEESGAHRAATER